MGKTLTTGHGRAPEVRHTPTVLYAPPRGGRAHTYTDVRQVHPTCHQQVNNTSKVA